MRGLLCPSLIGRADELEELTGALDEAAQARGSVVFVAGEAGIGKTRLVQETIAAARERNFKVLTGRATIPHSTIAFRPLTEALFSYFRDQGPPDLAELEPFRPALARLVPEWRRTDGPGGDDSVVVLAEAILRLLRVLSRDGGCLVVLEDLHWADPETLSILEYLAENLASEAVTLVATVRTEEPSAGLRLANALAARRSAPTITLGRLDASCVSAMASACLASDDVPSAVDSMLSASADGLPFFVEELLAGAVGSGALTQGDGGWCVEGALVPDIPQTFRDSVESRLHAFGDAADVILTAAVLGRSFDWTLLPTITGLDEATVLQALRAAAQAQLLVVDASNGGSFRFRHALTREAVIGELLPAEWSTLALRALAAIEAAHPNLPGEACDLGARLAERGGDRRRAAELLLESGRRSLARGALASAEDALVRARELADDPADAADVTEALCEVLSLAGKAAPMLEEGAKLIVDLAALDASTRRIGRVHLWLARTAADAGWWDVVDDQVRAARACAEAADDAELTARASAIGADLLIAQGDAPAAVALAESAVQLADELGLPDLGCEALQVVGRGARVFDLTRAEEAFSQSHALAERHGLELWRMRALFELGSIDLLSGASDERIRRARDVALAYGAVAVVAQIDFQHAIWNLDRHELDAAESWARRAVEFARPFGMKTLTALSFTMQGAACGWRGDRDRMEVCLSEALEAAGDEFDVVGCVETVARAVVSLIEENRERAVAELTAGMDAFAKSSTTIPAPQRGLWALVCAVIDADGAHAVQTVHASEVTVHAINRGFVQYAEAVLSGRAGNHAAAEESVAAGDVGLSHVKWFRALARRLMAEAAIADGWGDPASWLRDALVEFEDRGQDRLASATRSLMAKAGAPVPRRRADSNVPPELRQLGVTDREYEVVTLLGEGLANKEIAERLYLSPRTVERHIANVAVKAGLRTRSELVAFAAKNA